MDISMISDFISNFGFPIAVAVAMFWYVNKQDERHREEMGEMRKTLEDNTTVLSGLKDIISVFITNVILLFYESKYPRKPKEPKKTLTQRRKERKAARRLKSIEDALEE